MLKIPSEVETVTKILEKQGFLAYVVGGCLRDLLLGSKPKDWDIATSAGPNQITALFSKTFYENRYGTVTVVNEETNDGTLKNIEITPFRKETTYSDKRHPDKVIFGANLEDDLGRRDFTINALAYNLSKGHLVDLYKGQKDIKDKIIRTVGAPEDRFAEDALRIMRAIRLAAQLNFTISHETAEAIAKKAADLKLIATERIKDEFTKILVSKNPLIGLALGQKLGIWKQILPELEEGVHVKQNADHKYDVWEHSLRATQHAADKDYSLEVRLAGLLHDIAKPKTRQWSEEKKDWIFYGHEATGARIAEKIMKKLRFPHKSIETVTKLVRNHMFFSDIEKITLSAVRRVIRKVGRDLIWRLMEVRNCDRIGMGRPKETPYRLRKYHSMIEEALRAPTSVSMLKINGNDVIRETNLNPGPKIGFILHALLEEVLDKPELNTAEYLIKKTKNLAKLPEIELEKLGAKGKERKMELEQEEIIKIRERFHVK